MKKVLYFLFFLIINFGGLAIGSWLMDGGPTSDWYINLNKAPWTPAGWVFGVAWTFIMLCFSWYLAELFYWKSSKKLWLLFALQVVLNVSWNWIFFNQRLTLLGLLSIVSLTLLILFYFFSFKADNLRFTRYLLLPYIVWLCIATSLNAYIVLFN